MEKLPKGALMWGKLVYDQDWERKSDKIDDSRIKYSLKEKSRTTRRTDRIGLFRTSQVSLVNGNL
jgi:hypothetical protein